MRTVVVVIPTYNERENIGLLIEKIEYQRDKIPQEFSLSILVVDDSSPDGTAQVVQEYAQKYKNIYLLKGKKSGLGVAYIRGFKYAMHDLNADVVFEMDADLSHDPNSIPQFLTEILNGSDFVIGSRYVTGGELPNNWSLLRKLNSRFGNIVARYITGLKGIQDCTSGYRAINTKILKQFDLNSLKVKGYVFQVSLLYNCMKRGAKITEVPICFIDRTKGKSKLKINDIFEFLLCSLSIRFSWLTLIPKLLFLLLILGSIYSIIIFVYHLKLLTTHTFLDIFVMIVSIILSIQGLFTLIWMLYAWEDPRKAEHHRSPSVFNQPKQSFTALIPARHEEKVIRDTIKSINSINYPEDLKEILVLCREDDLRTIQKVKDTISELQNDNIRLIIFNSFPINKPHSLNFGLREAKNDVVVVFDAEDEPSKDIYNVVNTVITNDGVDVVQGGVQLMNYRSYWFSAMNVMEYFFWFKSGLQFFTNFGHVTPLGGNTVFIKRKWLLKCNGWDEHCLTEDADIGIRLTLLGAKTKVIYDEKHTTKEETPSTLTQLMKQRTRWNQGFLSCLFKGNWIRLPEKRQKTVALYILLSPEIQAIFLLYLPFAIWIALTHKVVFMISLLSFLPLYIYLFQIIVYIVGLYIFTKLYKLKFPIAYPLRFFMLFFVYQLILSISAFRAISRFYFGKTGWEKTLHVNNHRILLHASISYS